LPDNPRNIEPISGIRLHRALEGLYGILGRPMVDLLIVDLERQGITLTGDAAYSMTKIEQALINIFGSEGGPLLVDKILKSLESQQHSLR
jgi:hypothetical protein